MPRSSSPRWAPAPSAGWFSEPLTARTGCPTSSALAVIERIGQLSGADDWMDLSILAADPNEQIRAAAGRCLTGCPVIDS
jgi:hypothetical protein